MLTGLGVLPVLVVGGMVHGFTGGQWEAPVSDWSQATVALSAPVFRGDGQQVSVWAMAETPDEWTQVGLLAVRGSGPQLFVETEDAGGDHLALLGPATSATVAVSCDFGTDTYHAWIDGRLAATVTLDQGCGDGTWTQATETEAAPGNPQPSATTSIAGGFIVVDGAEDPLP